MRTPLSTTTSDVSLTPLAQGTMPGRDRMHTFNVMLKRIESYGLALYNAHEKFLKALTAHESDLNRAVEAARQSVDEARKHLHPFETLVSLGPHQVAHMAVCVERVIKKIEQIDRVSLAIVEKQRVGNVPHALRALANACRRTSDELENNLGGPIRKTYDKIANSAPTSDSLTA